MHKGKVKKWFTVLPIAWMTVIFLFSHQPGNESGELSGSMTAFIIRVIPVFGLQVEQDAVHNIIRGMAHFSIFFVLGILWYFSFRLKDMESGRAAVISVVISIAYAVTDELHQLFIPGRACEIKDVVVDTAGVLLALCVGQGDRFFTDTKTIE